MLNRVKSHKNIRSIAQVLNGMTHTGWNCKAVDLPRRDVYVRDFIVFPAPNQRGAHHSNPFLTFWMIRASSDDPRVTDHNVYVFLIGESISRRGSNTKPLESEITLKLLYFIDISQQSATLYLKPNLNTVKNEKAT